MKLLIVVAVMRWLLILKIMFKIGEKVVCIDDSEGFSSGLKTLIINEIYTIKSIRSCTAALAFNEINAPYDSSGFYSANRFRKLDYSFAENVLAKIKEEFFNDEVAHAIA